MPALLIGNIDTKEEVETVLLALQDKTLLAVNTNIKRDLDQIFKQWQALRRIQGDVDTPQEIRLLLGMLREDGRLSGAINTQQEERLFIEDLREQGILRTSLANAKSLDAVKEANAVKEEVKKEANDDEKGSSFRR